MNKKYKFLIILSIAIATMLLYVNKFTDRTVKLSNSTSYNNQNFNSGITIKDIGKMVIIEQKPDATVIIDKDDLDSIIAFLNSSSE
tara:strand:+ start:490 stop:747 length:258 start_codon:yes stop_codon:yes gene_type:complete